MKTEIRRSDIIVYCNVNLKLLTKLIKSAFVGKWTTYIRKYFWDIVSKGVEELLSVDGRL